MASPEALIAACGAPVAAHWLTVSEVSRAATEGRLIDITLTSSMGDSSAFFGFADDWGVTAEGRIHPTYLVFPRPIPPGLRDGGSGWEEVRAVFAAFGVDPAAEPPALAAHATTASAISDELVARVIATPDDDAPRRVIADALLAAANPRGEFIAVQCELARPALTPRQRNRLGGAEKRLLEAHAASWLIELGFQDLVCEFRRGFVEVAELSRGLGALGTGWEKTPLRELTIAGNATLAQLASHPLLARLQGLSLQWCEPGAALVAQLVRAPLAHFKSKGLLAGPGLEALTSSTLSQTLTSLELWRSQSFSRGIAAIARATWKQLQSLTLCDEALQDADAAVLAAASGLASLKTLDLSRNRVGDAGAIAIATSPSLRSLETLVLSFNKGIAGGAAAALAAPANLPVLRHLELIGARFSPLELAALTKRFGNRLKV